MNKLFILFKHIIPKCSFITISLLALYNIPFSLMFKLIVSGSGMIILFIRYIVLRKRIELDKHREKNEIINNQRTYKTFAKKYRRESIKSIMIISFLTFVLLFSNLLLMLVVINGSSTFIANKIDLIQIKKESI